MYLQSVSSRINWTNKCRDDAIVLDTHATRLPHFEEKKIKLYHIKLNNNFKLCQLFYKQGCILLEKWKSLSAVLYIIGVDVIKDALFFSIETAITIFPDFYVFFFVSKNWGQRLLLSLRARFRNRSLYLMSPWIFVLTVEFSTDSIK